MPDKWTTTTLGEVAEWYSGGTPKAGEPKFYHGGTIPWVVIADMANGEIRETETSITRDGLEQIGGRLAPVESTLVSMYATVGRAAITHIPVATNQAIAWSVVDQKKMIPRFLFLIAQSLEKEIASAARGATQRNINRAMLREFQFQLPTLIEQRRIVDLVSSVDSYIFALQQQADAARAARNAVLSELLSAGGEDWTETTLGDISNFISLRVTPAKLDAVTPYVGLEHLVPRSAEISDWDTVRSISSSVTPFEPGDTLFGRLRPYLHKVAFAGFAGTCSPELLVLRSNTKCDAGFLYLLCALDSTIRKCVAMSAGTRMPRTSTSDLASIEIQLPPVVEQQRIVSVISSLDEVIRSTEQAVAGSKRLRSGLLSDLLAGKHEIPESYDRLFGVT